MGRNPAAYFTYAEEHNLTWMGDPDNPPRTTDPTLWRCNICGGLLQTPLNNIRHQPHGCGKRIDVNNLPAAMDVLATKLNLTWYGPDVRITSDVAIWTDSKGRKLAASIDTIRRTPPSQIAAWFDLIDQSSSAN